MSASESVLGQATATVRRPVLRQIIAVVGTLHCRLFHRGVSRPVNGKYRCWTCLREFDLQW